MKKTILLCLTALMFSFANSFAQDKIILKSGEEKEGWVAVQSDKVIKYRLTKAVNSPVIILKTSKVEKVIYRNGEKVSLKPAGIRMEKRLAINAGVITELANESDGFYKLQADYFVTSGFTIVLSNFFQPEGDSGFALGAMHYFTPHRPTLFKPYAGLLGGVRDDNFMLQIPVGINFTTKLGFDAKLGLSGVYTADSHDPYVIHAELLIGWRF